MPSAFITRTASALRHWDLIAPSLALLLALLVSVHSFASYSPGDDTDEVTGTVGCVNTKLEVSCRFGKCGEEVCETTLIYPSLILPGGLRYHTWSHDYISHADAAACQPCGGSGVSAGRLPELRITRYTEPLSYTRDHLAFGVLSGLKTYDQSLRLERNKSHVTFDNFGEWNAKITTDFNPGLQAWTTIWRIDQGIAAIHLFNADGQPITLKADRDTAHTAVVMRYDGTSSHFEIFWNANGDGWGRLVALLDRHGNAIEIEYIDPHFDTLLDPIGNPRDYFRKSLIRDAYGREAEFTYQLISTRHVVTRIDLPNGEHITYAYGGSPIGSPVIQTATHADGSESSWSVVNNTDTKTTEVTIYDAKADAGHRRKKVFLTQNSSFAPGGGTMTTVRNRIRRAQNGAGEFVYDSRFSDNLADRYIYTGGKSVKKYIFPDGNNGLGSAQHVTNDLWVGAFHTSDPNTWTTETELVQRQNNNAHFAVSRQDTRTRTKSITRDPLSLRIIGNQYADGTTSATPRNQFSQVLTSTDRLGRQTANTYSPLGDQALRANDE